MGCMRRATLGLQTSPGRVAARSCPVCHTSEGLPGAEQRCQHGKSGLDTLARLHTRRYHIRWLREVWGLCGDSVPLCWGDFGIGQGDA